MTYRVSQYAVMKLQRELKIVVVDTVAIQCVFTTGD